MLTILEILDGDAEGAEDAWKSPIPIAVIDKATDGILEAWEAAKKQLDDAEAAGTEPDGEQIQYNMGTIAGLVWIADAVEDIIPYNDNWKDDAAAVEILRIYEDIIDNFTRAGTIWEAWGKRRAAQPGHREFIEELRALDTEEEE